MSKFFAYYSSNRGADQYPVDVNGDSLDEVIADQIEFWNGSAGSHEDFELVETWDGGNEHGVHAKIEGYVDYEYQDMPAVETLVEVWIGINE